MERLRNPRSSSSWKRIPRSCPHPSSQALTSALPPPPVPCSAADTAWRRPRGPPHRCPRRPCQSRDGTPVGCTERFWTGFDGSPTSRRELLQYDRVGRRQPNEKRKAQRCDYHSSGDKQPTRVFCLSILSLFPIGCPARKHLALEFTGGNGSVSIR